MSHDEYLRTFFIELGRLQPGNKHGVSHALAYEDGTIYALVGMGDARAIVALKEVDPDPVKMAAKVVELWRGCIDEKKLVLER
jgi:uncharacterized cupin superfamily protein